MLLLTGSECNEVNSEMFTERTSMQLAKKKAGLYEFPNSGIISKDIVDKADENITRCLETKNEAFAQAVCGFNTSTSCLKERAKQIYLLRNEIEHTGENLLDSISKLKARNRKLQYSLLALEKSFSIANECYELRLTRLESTLFDETQSELNIEIKLIRNVKYLCNDLLNKSKRQLESNDAIKELIDLDYSDKTNAYEIENHNLGLDNKSSEVRTFAGVAKPNNSRSNHDSWEAYTFGILRKCEAEIRDTVSCCEEIDASLLNSARDITTQKHKVNKSVEMSIANTERLKQQFEKKLQMILKKIVETEKVMDQLKDELKAVDQRLRVNNTRLHNKNDRPYIENCCEDSLNSLIKEEKSLNDFKLELKERLKESDDMLKQLWSERALIEKEITIKKKSLYIDKDRCRQVRDCFPETNELSGHHL